MSDPKIIAAKKKRMEELDEGIKRSYKEYGETVEREFGQIVDMDTSDTRREALIQSLRDSEIMSEEQYYDFEILFFTKVEEQLNEVWVTLREALAQKKKPKLSVVKKPSVLTDKHGRPLSSG